MDKLMNTYHIYTVCMSPALNRNSVLEQFEHSNAICNGIMLDFYPGLPHIMYVLYFVVGTTCNLITGKVKCTMRFHCFEKISQRHKLLFNMHEIQGLTNTNVMAGFLLGGVGRQGWRAFPPPTLLGYAENSQL